MNVRPLAPHVHGFARLAGGLDLFRCPHVGLRKLYVLFRAGNLTFMSFR
jgi:hypothetical protein